MDPFDPPLDKPRHLRYWQRCVRSLLPHHYTSMDSTRLSLGFFIIAAVDLLTPENQPPADADKPRPTPATVLTPSDRRALRSWVLACQHPLGGFAGSPTHILPGPRSPDDPENAHLGGTYFALLLLALLSSDKDAGAAFAGVDSAACLRWLRRLQRPSDGSFGEVVYRGGSGTGEDVIGGGRDMRYCYLAAAVRWMLRGESSEEEDIDVAALVAHIRRGQTYDGGFAESWRHESHAGYGYCAAAALALLDRPAESGWGGGETARRGGIADQKAFVSWLFSRQFAYVEKQEQSPAGHSQNDEDPETSNFVLADLGSLSDENAGQPPSHIGFNGRCNKIADTCYTWWTLGALAVLDPAPRADPAALRAQRLFLLDKTQHAIGGFGKNPGSPPDVGHGYLGLAALATMGDPGLRRLDPALCVSVDAVKRVEAARQGLLRQQVGKQAEAEEKVELGQRLVAIAVKMGGGERPEWFAA